MHTQRFIGTLSALLLVTAPAVGQDVAPALGRAFWVYSGGFSIQELSTASAGVPQFAVGVRKDRLRLGVGIGIVRLNTLEKSVFGPQSSSETTLRAMLFQVVTVPSRSMPMMAEGMDSMSESSWSLSSRICSASWVWSSRELA